MRLYDWIQANTPDPLDDPNFVHWVSWASVNHVTYRPRMKQGFSGNHGYITKPLPAIKVRTPEPVIDIPHPPFSECCEDEPLVRQAFISEARQLLADYTTELERVIAEVS